MAPALLLPARILLLMLGFGLAVPAAAQPPADPRDVRIADLEARVARLEALLRQSAGDRSTAAPLAMPAEPPVASIVEPAEETPAPAVSRVPQELLPSLGKIGAAASFVVGAHSGPFQLNSGPFVGGSVELPLFRARGGRVLYEFSAGLGMGDTHLRVTSNVAQVANLAVLANTVPTGGASNVEAAFAGRAPAPFAVQYDVTSRLRLLQVSPFGLKYTFTGLDRWGLRPYAAAGLGLYVTITNQASAADASQGPFAGALIGGQIVAASELTARGVPSGQGGIDLGGAAGGGVEWRARRGFSLGVDVRVNRLTSGRSFTTAATRAGFHF